MSDNFGVDSDPTIFEVEAIVGKKYQDGVPMYKVRWKHYDENYDTWEPLENLENCDDILNEFESSEIAARADEEEEERLRLLRENINSGQKMGLPLPEIKENSKKSKSKGNDDLKPKNNYQFFLSDSSSDSFSDLPSNSKSTKIYESDYEDEGKKHSQQNKAKINVPKPKQNDDSTDISFSDSSSYNDLNELFKPSVPPKSDPKPSAIPIAKRVTTTKPKQQSSIGAAKAPITSARSVIPKSTSKPKTSTSAPKTSTSTPKTSTNAPITSIAPNIDTTPKKEKTAKAPTKVTEEAESKSDFSDEENNMPVNIDYSQVASIVFSFKNRSELKKCEMRRPNYKRLYGVPEYLELPSSFKGEPVVAFRDFKIERNNKYVYAELKGGHKEWILLDAAKCIDRQLLIDFLIDRYSATH